MKNLIHAELLKLRTTRMIYGLALASLAIPLVSVISAITSAGKSGGDPALSTPEGIRNVMSTSLFGGLLGPNHRHLAHGRRVPPQHRYLDISHIARP